MANSTTANAGTVLTVPANKIWQGSVSLSATLAVSIGGSAGTQFPSITVSGLGANWADGDVVLKLALAVPAVGALSLAGATASGSVSTPEIRIRTRANPVSLILNIGAGVTGVGTAVGHVI